MTATTYPDRDAWRAARRAGLGASDMYALMGTAPPSWGLGAHSVWRSKVMDLPERDEEHLNMGHLIEPVILAEFARRQGLHVEHVGARNLIARHATHEWALCSPDGLASEGPYDDLESCLGPVQAKRATNVWEWEELPAYISDQVMWECFVLGKEMGWVVAEHRQSIGIYEVSVDEIRVKQMVERGRWLWEEHVLTDTEPPLDADEDPSDAWPDEDPAKAVQVDYELVQRLAQVSANANAWDKKRKDLKRQLQAQMKDAAVGLDGNDEIVRWETVERRGYTVKPSSYRRLSLLVSAEEAEETE